MNATLPVDPATRRLEDGAHETLCSAFPDHFGHRLATAVADALRDTTMDVDEVCVSLSTDGGWFADILLCGGGRLESVVARLRPSPVAA